MAVCWNCGVNEGIVMPASSHLRVAVCWNSGSSSTSTAETAATFGWLCVETRREKEKALCLSEQPPSGGCVLKQTSPNFSGEVKGAATFGWLCIETKTSKIIHAVEPAATFGRLCVETLMNLINYSAWLSSRLQAAVCWNYNLYHQKVAYVCSHLRVAVCWNHHQQRDCI